MWRRLRRRRRVYNAPLNARVQVSAKTRGGGTTARWEDIDKIIPPVRLSAPSRPRTLFQGIPGVPLAHLSRVFLSVFLRVPLVLFHPLERGSPTARRAKRGWLEGKRIYTRRRMRERDEGGGWGNDDEWKPPRHRHSRNDFVLRACLIMNPHPGEAPPPFARRTTTNGSSPRGSSRENERGKEEATGESGIQGTRGTGRAKRARRRRKRLLPAARWPSVGLNCTVYYPCGISNYLFLLGPDPASLGCL